MCRYIHIYRETETERYAWQNFTRMSAMVSSSISEEFNLPLCILLKCLFSYNNMYLGRAQKNQALKKLFTDSVYLECKISGQFCLLSLTKPKCFNIKKKKMKMLARHSKYYFFIKFHDEAVKPL